jgi:hypothetical protein
MIVGIKIRKWKWIGQTIKDEKRVGCALDWKRQGAEVEEDQELGRVQLWKKF